MRWLLCLVLLGVGCAEHKKEVQYAKQLTERGVIETKDDEFTKSTRITYRTVVDVTGGGYTKEQRKKSGAPTVFEFVLAYEAPSEVPLVYFSLNSRSWSDWQYLKCHGLILLVDGQSISPETEHDGDTSSSSAGVSLYENISTGIDRETLKRIAEAKEVRGRLCNDEFALSAAQIATIQDFAKRIGITAGTVMPESVPVP